MGLKNSKRFSIPQAWFQYKSLHFKNIKHTVKVKLNWPPIYFTSRVKLSQQNYDPNKFDKTRIEV